MTSEQQSGEADRVGAAVWFYEHREISLGRGSELAAMTWQEFRDELEERGVRPRFGPEDPEELHRGVDLDG